MEMSKMSNSSYLGLLIIGDSTHSAWPSRHYFWPLLPNFGQWNFKLKAKNTGTNCFWEEVPVISQNSSKSSIWKSLSISQSGREGTSNYLMGIEHQQSKCVQVKLKWVQGQHAQKNHWQATISLVSMDKIPTKCLKLFSMTYQREWRIWPFCLSIKDFWPRYKALCKHMQRNRGRK